MYRLFAVCLFLCLSIHAGWAQHYHFTGYSLKEGLSQSQVYSLMEDSRGKLWIGTQGGGVDVFDGIGFENYSELEGLANNFVNAIAEDEDLNVWVGTDEGVTVFDGDTAHSFLFDEEIACLVSDSGTMLVGTANGLLKCTLSKNTFGTYEYEASNNPITSMVMDTSWVLKGEVVDDVKRDSLGRYLLGTENGLMVWDGKALEAVGGKHHLRRISSDGKGGWWLAYYGLGLWYLGPDGVRKMPIELGKGNVVSLYVDPLDKSVWAGTLYGGLYHLRGKDDEVELIRQYGVNNGLGSNRIRSVLRDRDGGLWIGNSGAGVYRFSGDRFLHFGEDEGVLGGGAFSIQGDKKGLWIGCFAGGLVRLDDEGYRHFGIADGLTDAKIYSMAKMGDEWYFGSEGRGLYRYDGERFERQIEVEKQVGRFVRTLLPDGQGGLWIGSADCGLLHWKTDGTFVKFSKTKGELGGDRVNDLAYDQDSALWVANFGGVSVFKEDQKVAIPALEVLDGIRVKSVVCDQWGRMWLGTNGKGLFCYSDKELKPVEGLHSRNIYMVHWDKLGRLWVGTERGLDRFSFDRNGEINGQEFFGYAEGFTGMELIQNAVWEDANNHLWFGTVKGLSCYFPELDADRISQEVPAIELNEIRLFYKPLQNTAYGEGLSGWSKVPSGLELEYDENHLSFNFQAVSLQAGKDIFYEWKLEGFDKEWSPRTTQQLATYSNLPSGHYSFKVRPILNGVSGEETQFTFKVNSPFWVRWWFLLGFFVFGLSIAWLVYSWRKKVWRERDRKKHELEVLSLKLSELEQKSLRLQMNPHFLFNCLNSIKGLIAEGKAREARLNLTRFARLMRSTLDHSRLSHIPLNQELDSLRSYLELEQMSHEGKFDFHINAPEESIDMLVPPMLVQPFVENALIHGVLPKGDGEVSVSFLLEGGLLKCVVEDNGVGREKAMEKKSKDHQSSGLAITQERLRLLFGEKAPEEVVVFEDHINASGDSQGTSVSIFIPPFIS